MSGHDLARTLGDFAVNVQGGRGEEAILAAIVNGAVGIVPGAHWAGISQITGRTIEARVPSDPLVTKLDALQNELNEGPCITALREHRTVSVDDMTVDTRWPTFAAEAVAHGVHCSLSFQLFVHGDNLGALNLYGAEAEAFNEESLLFGEILAQHASVAMAGAKAELQFDKALASRDAIGQAKGILMHRYDVDATAAFAMLMRLSQDGNTKLTEVARRVIETRKTI